MEIITPKDYVGKLMELAQHRRGEFVDMQFLTEARTTLTYELPLAEVTINIHSFLNQCFQMWLNLYNLSPCSLLASTNQGISIYLSSSNKHIFELKPVLWQCRRCMMTAMVMQVVTDFFDDLKSRSQGYASMEYSQIGYRPNRLVRLDIRINNEVCEPLANIVHRDNAYTVGRSLVKRLKELIPRQQFKFSIQAAIGGKIVASEGVQGHSCSTS